MKAFPTEHAIAGTMDFKADGMDLRDYFAAKALQGYLAQGFSAELKPSSVCERCYAYSDAMMKARKNDS
jgi:hypothetical protein